MKRVAERPASEERIKTLQIRDESGEMSASAELRRRPNARGERSGYINDLEFLQ